MGLSLFLFGMAFFWGFRYAVARRAGRFQGRNRRLGEGEFDDPSLWVDRDDDPERFGFWQGVNLVLCGVFMVLGLLSVI
jgi:hypothetical protein